MIYPDLGRLTARFSRDAIHMAVIPVTADERLHPGAPVSIAEHRAVLAPVADAVGVVDPFLPDFVEKGQRFWLLLKPGSITGLRHEWSHPEFPSRLVADIAEHEESERWLREFIGDAESYGDTFEGVIDDLVAGRGGTLYGREESQAPEEFWFHLERFTGIAVPRAGNEYFVCRC